MCVEREREFGLERERPGRRFHLFKSSTGRVCVERERETGVERERPSRRLHLLRSCPGSIYIYAYTYICGPGGGRVTLSGALQVMQYEDTNTYVCPHAVYDTIYVSSYCIACAIQSYSSMRTLESLKK